MDDFALTPAERALFRALNRRGVPFIIIGMGAAVLQGAPVATQDLDVWFAQREIEGVTLRVLPLERVIASKRATRRANDLAQLPVLEATLLAREDPGHE